MPMIEQKNGDKRTVFILMGRNVQELTIQHGDRVENGLEHVEIKKKCKPVSGDDRQIKNTKDELVSF